MKTTEGKPVRVGRPVTVGASVKATFLIDPPRMQALAALSETTQRSRNSLLREAIDDLLAKRGIELPR